MRANAIIRIVIYSLVILALLGLLVTGLCVDLLTFDINESTGTVVATGSSSVDAAGIDRLEIDWVAGSVIIQTGDSDLITFSESGSFSDNQAMIFENKNGTLHISYAKPAIRFGFDSMPSKDLVITVPRDWSCRELELDGAALEIKINGLSIGELNIDGASSNIVIDGAVGSLDCDGAACEITMNCTDRPRAIDLDGAACRLMLTLPKDCGFLLQMEGLSCVFGSNLSYTRDNGNYMYGDRYCKINTDGMACEVQINAGE